MNQQKPRFEKRFLQVYGNVIFFTDWRKYEKTQSFRLISSANGPWRFSGLLSARRLFFEQPILVTRGIFLGIKLFVRSLFGRLFVRSLLRSQLFLRVV